jgi:hypothetical protein
MAALVSPPCTTSLIDGLCVFPYFAVPHSINRYQREIVLAPYLEHELPVRHLPTQQVS